MGNYTHLVDKFSPLVRDMDLGSSITTDKLIHELYNPFCKFALQGLGFLSLAGVVNGSNYGVMPLFSWWQLCDVVNAKLCPWHPGNWDRFQLLTTLFKLPSTFHTLAGDTAFDVIYNLLSEAWEVHFGLDEGNSLVSAKVTTYSLDFN